jgi:propanol-preferring alcohol dehydrogenase
MIAMQLMKPGPIDQQPLVQVEIPIPQPGPGQLLIRVIACGVCHTDLHTVEGEIHPPHLPIVPGHQVVGRVEALGEIASVHATRHWKVGERVGVPWLYSACGTCDFCRGGQENLCSQARFTGFHTNGGYAGWMIAEADWALPLPGRLSDEQATPLLCAGLIGYRSLRLADLQPGERLGLVGFGASAHLAIQIARGWGCEVFVFTRSANHRQHAHALGASWVGGIEEQAPAPIDRAVVFAPAGELVPQTLNKLRPGGTLAINAVYMSDLPTMPYSAIYGERTLRSVSNATYQDGLDILRIAEEMNLHSTITTNPLTKANQALQDLKISRFDGEAVLLP